MNTLQARIRSFKKHSAELKAELEELMAWYEVISFLHEQRTGQELRPGEKFSAEDAQRAEEIMRLYPGNES